MKLGCEILAAESCGNTMKIKLQGKKVDAAAWHDWCVMTIEIPATAKAKRAFHVGRVVTLTVSPE